MDKIKTYIINMESAISRREYMVDICSGYHDFLDIEFFDAVNGNLLSKDELYKQYNSNKAVKLIGRDLNKGEIGCVLSHLGVYKKILDSNLDYALILEDDVVLDDKLILEIRSISSYPKGWDIILYGHYSYYLDGKEISSPVSIWNKYKRRDHLTLYKLVRFGYGTHGYLVSKNGAKKLLEELSDICLPMDHYTSNNKLFNIYAVLPTLVKVNTKFDSIINQNELKKGFLKRSHVFWKLRNFILSLSLSL